MNRNEDEGFEEEIKLERDIHGRGYLCEIDPCMEDAAFEVVIGKTSISCGSTWLVCEGHRKNIWEIYERRASCRE